MTAKKIMWGTQVLLAVACVDSLVIMLWLVSPER